MAQPLSTVIRDRATITAAREAALSNDFHDRNFIAGAVAAYDWLLGTQPAPLSGTTEVSARTIAAEEELAETAITGQFGAPQVTREWAVGLQHALMWGRYAADTPPVDLV